MFARRKKTHSDYTPSDIEPLRFSDDNRGYISCPRCFQLVKSEFAVLHPDGKQTCFDCSWDRMESEVRNG